MLEIEEKIMRKRKLIICLIIILLIVIGIVIYIYYNKLPTEPLNEATIKELLNKYDDIENIRIETSEKFKDRNTIEEVINKKGEKALSVSKSKNHNITDWEDLKTGEHIKIDENSKVWVSIPQNKSKDENENIYKFIKYEKYNNSKCAVIELTNTSEYTKENPDVVLITNARMWVDLKTGISLKTEYIDNFGDEYESYSTVTLNKVKDEDVAKPNLDGYTEYDINKDEELEKSWDEENRVD